MGPSVSEQALFSVLPRWKTPWSELFLSYGVQAIAIAILVWVPLLHPEILEPPKKDYHAIELVPTPVPVNHEPQRQLPRPVVVAKLDPPPAALRLAAPQPQPKPKVEDAQAPEVKIVAKKQEALPVPSTPAIPKQLIRTNLFSTGSSAPQTIERPAAQVQTGGFGDPNGVPAKTTQTRAVNIAQAGGFDMPTGPGYGNGTGGANGARGVVRSTGFGDGTAVQQSSSSNRGTVRTAGFGSADVPAPPTVAHAAAPTVAKVVPAEILSKPSPIYTEEARAAKIEGEVLLEVVFEASGKLHVVKVVRGLGHGLDDAAVRAAEQIRFKPALKDGQPSDSTALIHIIFQLA
ncbi:MAG TPA: TonB family protein [Candidatus Sulfotelmatobacter sp.]|nr:TonB family protein [Candidatus Sulfotelmatobacter sp.]